MGMRPCMRCRRRFVGKASHIYPAIMTQPEPWRQKAALCPTCFYEIIEWAKCHLANVNYDAEPENADVEDEFCPVCGSGQQKMTAIFITAYPAGGERLDFFGECCDDHASDVVEVLGYHPLHST